MKKKLIALSGLVGAGFMPFLALAQSPPINLGGAGFCGSGISTNTFEYIVCRAGSVLNTVIPVLIVLAVVYFIWGVAGYVISKDEEAKKRGKDKMIYGIIGLVVIVAMWGLVSIVTTSFGVNQNVQVNIPTVPGI
jgi:hypothetical protein